MNDKLQQAYVDHGKRIEENIAERVFIENYMNSSPEHAASEVELCLRHNPDFTEDYGILRFFKYHLFTHDPRKNIVSRYSLENPQMPFLLFDFQKEAVKEYVNAVLEGYDVLTEKSRDMGVSWIVISVALWFWLQRGAGNDILIGSQKFEKVDKKGKIDTLLEKFRYNLYRIHLAFWPENYNREKDDNVGSIINRHTGSFISGEANNENFATSGRYLFIIPDEYSKWLDTDDKAWTSMGDATPCRLPVSTPWGLGRKFAKLRFQSDIKVLTFHWSKHPIKGAGKYKGDDPYLETRLDDWLSPWYLEECTRRTSNPEEEIGQELNIDYLSTGSPYFNNAKVQKEQKKLEANPPKVTKYEYILRADDDGNEYIELFESPRGRVWIKEEAVKDWKYRYCLSGDVAEGLEHGDNSACYIFDRNTGEDVAGFCGKIDTRTFAFLLAHFGNLYNDCYIAPENNSQGAAVLQKLKEIYPYIYHEQRFDQVVDFDTVKLGWNTNKKTRAIMCSAFREAIDDGCHGVVEKEVFGECLTFVNINGKPQADPGNWDDRVMAQAIKWMIHDWLPSPRILEVIDDKFKGITAFSGGRKVITQKDKRSIW